MIFIIEDDFFEFLQISFDLKNAFAHFQWTIDAILDVYHWDFILAFIDNIIIFSHFFENHLKYISLILEALKKVEFIMNEKKYHFIYDNIELLEHRISRLRLSILKEKMIIILIISFSETIKKTQEILEIFNYYHLFIQFFAWIIISLYKKLKKIINKLFQFNF